MLQTEYDNILLTEVSEDEFVEKLLVEVFDIKYFENYILNDTYIYNILYSEENEIKKNNIHSKISDNINSFKKNPSEFIDNSHKMDNLHSEEDKKEIEKPGKNGEKINLTNVKNDLKKDIESKKSLFRNAAVSTSKKMHEFYEILKKYVTKVKIGHLIPAMRMVFIQVIVQLGVALLLNMIFPVY